MQWSRQLNKVKRLGIEKSYKNKAKKNPKNFIDLFLFYLQSKCGKFNNQHQIFLDNCMVHLNEYVRSEF